ncbi:MAG: glutamate mutase L, partial [Clostridia bacterium]|nr:glutamate mutase L [Clostridia bacterium]
TTVEGPGADVMAGVREALARLALLSGRPLLEGGELVMPESGGAGVDAVLVTSSAAGGLQMLCAGVVRQLTAESAERAALGAGAIVTDVVALDTADDPLAAIQRVRDLRPDIVLLAGGTDESDPTPVVRLAEWIAAARPTSRTGGGPVPVVFAGNRAARPWVERAFDGVAPVVVTDNVRPDLATERTETVREVVHELFLDHVMKHAPGYEGLVRLAGDAIEPTPRAAGRLLEAVAARYRANVLAFDIGGATTDVFSVVDGRFHRSVSANFGMSYSAAHVLETAGLENVLRWLPDWDEPDRLVDLVYEKSVRPTTVPEEPDELAWEQALAREAIRLSFEHHLQVAVTLKGVRQERSFDDVFRQEPTGRPLVAPGRIDVLVGSGGVLSHAPEPWQALAILVDAVRLGGVFRVYLDEFFLLPHAGSVARHDAELARRLWFRYGLRPLATCVVAWGRAAPGQPAFDVVLEGAGVRQRLALRWGDVRRLALAPGSEVAVDLRPRGGVDVGAGPGRPRKEVLRAGELGLVFDARGCPIRWPQEALGAGPAAAARAWRDAFAGAGLAAPPHERPAASFGAGLA